MMQLEPCISQAIWQFVQDFLSRVTVVVVAAIEESKELAT